MGGGELFLILEHPGGSVPRRAGASCRAGAIRCDPELARGWSGLSPRPGNRHFGGAPSPCQRPFIFWVASEHANNVIEMRFRGRKVPEGPHLVAPDSRHWRAVGRTALRAMGNISVHPRPCAAPVAAHPEKGQKQMQPGLSRVDIERHGPPGLGQVAPGRWHGVIYHARLASFPIHMGVFLTQRGRCSETDLRKFLDFFG